MEALWSLEEKLKLTTREAVFLLAGTAAAVAAVCGALVLRKKSGEKKISDPEWVQNRAKCSSSVRPGWDWARIKTVLMGSLRWSRAATWKPERQAPVLIGLERSHRWLSHGSASPVWQRPILMGEKCEFPRFSGLILYDERGRLLDFAYQEKPAAPIRTTLRDLL